MENPSLKHFKDGYVSSDLVEALVGETWINAIYTNEGWFTPDLATKLVAVTEWRDGKEADQGRKEDWQGDERVQSRNAPKRQTGSRSRPNRKKP